MTTPDAAEIDRLFEEAEKLRFEDTAYIAIDELKKSIKDLFAVLYKKYAFVCEANDELRLEYSAFRTESEAKIAELVELNKRAKDVLEKTLDCEAAACVARNRLEFKIQELESRLEQAMEAIKEFVDQGSCWELDWDKKINLEGDDVIETELPCGKCPYCKAKALKSTVEDTGGEK